MLQNVELFYLEKGYWVSQTLVHLICKEIHGFKFADENDLEGRKLERKVLRRVVAFFIEEEMTPFEIANFWKATMSPFGKRKYDMCIGKFILMYSNFKHV